VSEPQPRGGLRGVTFAKQFPNAAEPLRGLFVAEQVEATASEVDWRVIAPVPWAPSWLAGLLDKPFVRGGDVRNGVPVEHPRYPVLPRRLLYGTVAPAVAACSAAVFGRIVAEHRPSFVHAHALYPSAAAARRLAQRNGLPYVVSIHGSDLYTNLEHPAARRELLAAAAGAARVICVSESLARDARELLALPDGRVTVIPDTYDERRFAFAGRESHDGPVRLITVGRLVDVKGHDLLLESVAALVREGVDLSLELVGAGPNEPKLRARATAAGIGDRVRFSGALAPDAVREALSRADLFVLSSRREGFGVALVEALATGLPAVATRCGGPADIIGGGDGVLVGAGDAAELAAGIRDAVRRMGEFDRAAIAAGVKERFGSRRIAERLVAVYRDAVATRGAAVRPAILG
jgi:teichuronic acid biosynthesis glycosyltransferase TuaC